MLEILNVARSNSYDLVVIGSHAAVTGPARLIGDITHRIVEHAGRPVWLSEINDTLIVTALHTIATTFATDF